MRYRGVGGAYETVQGTERHLELSTMLYEYALISDIFCINPVTGSLRGSVITLSLLHLRRKLELAKIWILGLRTRNH